MSMDEIRSANVVRYATPLREGGSLPAIVEADDGFLYVMKFRGAGQGKKALIAELIGGEIARAIGLRVPELVFLNLDDSFSKTEADEEIQDLLKFSVGLNLGLHYLSGSITIDPLVTNIDSLTASKVVLLDSILINIDRTVKNPNLLSWNNELWLIDHGAGLYFHHSWETWEAHLERTFPAIKDHVLLGKASALDLAGREISDKLSDVLLEEIIEMVPSEWLEEDGNGMEIDLKRAAYLQILNSKLSKLELLIKEAKDAQK